MVVYGEPRVSHLKLFAVVVGVILQIVAVGGEEISHTDKLLVVANHLLEIRHHVHGELRSAVEAETCHLVAHSAVAEALAERLLVQFEVGVLRSGHVRSDVDIHKLAHELGDALVVHGSIHLAIAVEERRIREQRMRSVEQRELHVLERRNVIGHLCSDGLPCRATGSEVVLNDPLYEVLTVDWCLVVGAVLLVQSLYVLGACGWRDAVYHRVGERHVLFHPRGELLVLRLDERHERAACGVAVVLQVVARENGDRSGARSLAAAESFCYVAEGCERIGRVGEVVSHLCVVEHELARLS